MTDTQYLENLIKEKGIKKTYIADKLGITRPTLYSKMRNDSEFTGTEIMIFCELLNVTKLSEKDRIFFANKV